MRQFKIHKKNTIRGDISNKYLVEISHISLLKPDDEYELALRVLSGDTEAKSKLIEANLRFVVSVAKQYVSTNHTLMDLISEGNLGLIKAVEKYDPTKGFKFISYAVWWIRQSIHDYLGRSTTIRKPSNHVGLSSKVKNFKDKFLALNEREPTDWEIKEELELKDTELKSLKTAGVASVSLDAPISNSINGESSLLDVMINPSAIMPDGYTKKEWEDYLVSKVLSILTEREQLVVKNYFGICQDNNQALLLSDIADKLNITRERARQILEASLRKLRHSKKLRTFIQDEWA
jgi:RNA polymerase primary sigma factor